MPTGRLIRQLGDPDRVVTLRSTVKPFGLVALIEAGGIEAFDLEPAEIAIMASSHSGEDLHVRTLQGLFRRAGRQPGAARLRERGHAARRADRRPPRPRRREGRVRSATCAPGQHTVSLLLSRLKGWDLDDVLAAGATRRRSPTARPSPGRTARRPTKLRTAIDGCGVETYAFRLREVAQAYAMLADPTSDPGSATRAARWPPR